MPPLSDEARVSGIMLAVGSAGTLHILMAPFREAMRGKTDTASLVGVSDSECTQYRILN